MKLLFILPQNLNSIWTPSTLHNGLLPKMCLCSYLTSIYMIILFYSTIIYLQHRELRVFELKSHNIRIWRLFVASDHNFVRWLWAVSLHTTLKRLWKTYWLSMIHLSRSSAQCVRPWDVSRIQSFETTFIFHRLFLGSRLLQISIKGAGILILH